MPAFTVHQHDAAAAAQCCRRGGAQLLQLGAALQQVPAHS